MQLMASSTENTRIRLLQYMRLLDKHAFLIFTANKARLLLMLAKYFNDEQQGEK